MSFHINGFKLRQQVRKTRLTGGPYGWELKLPDISLTKKSHTKVKLLI